MSSSGQLDPILINTISNNLLTRHNLTVSRPWLTSLLQTQLSLPTPPPLPSLQQTTLFRLLASDFTTSLSTANPAAVFPADISNPHARERRLQGPVPVQLLDIRDLSVSLMEEVEAIERVERGEMKKGREINRAIPAEAMESSTTAGNSTSSTAVAAAVGRTTGIGDGRGLGPHKMVLQDASGRKVEAIELKRVEGIKVGMLMGSKLVLKDVQVGRGILLLEPRSVTVLGGKIEGVDTTWKQGRKARLLRTLKENNGPRAGTRNGR